MTQSKLLTQFYRDWLNWVDNGANPVDYSFSRKSGLCASLYVWCARAYLSGHTRECLSLEMDVQFRDAELNILYPFDDSAPNFSKATKTGAHHLNPKRIQWVRDHLNQGKKQ